MEKMNRITHGFESGSHSFESGYQHVPSDKPVRLAWLDQRGQIRWVAGRCIDVTRRRIHVEVTKQIPLRIRVMLRADGSNIAGSPLVKYVTRYDTKFILVLETGLRSFWGSGQMSILAASRHSARSSPNFPRLGSPDHASIPWESSL